MRSLAILGASGHGKVVAEAALLAGWGDVCFFDDAWPDKRQIGRWLVTGDTASLLNVVDRFDGVIVAIGDNTIRLAKLRALQSVGAHIATVIHPAAVVSSSARLGEGTVVMAGVVINSDTIIGEGGILNTACSVDHDCLLGDAVHISPGAHLAGGVRVGELAWVGIGAAVRQGLNIGRLARVGAGAAVINDIVDGQTVVGVPAKILIS